MDQYDNAKDETELDSFRTELDDLRRELLLKEKSSEREKESKKPSFGPGLITIIVALLGILASVTAAFVTGYQNLQLERLKQEFQIIITASEDRTQEEAASNLKFFVDIGVLEDRTGKIREYADAGKAPVITSGSPSNFTEPGHSVPVGNLPVDSAYREMSSAIGKLQYDSVSSTAWVISDEYILTFYYSGFQVQDDMSLTMGFLLPDSEIDVYDVDPIPVESNEELHYAIFRLRGNPSEKYGRIPFNWREPEMDESLFVIHHGNGGPLALANHPGCQVTENQFTQESDGWIGHSCNTPQGSAGSPIFATADWRILGMHVAGQGVDNAGIKIGEIVADSRILKELLEQ